jgi:hypothetical protein
MTARIVPASEVQRKRYQRACRKAAYEGEGVDQGSHFDRLQRQFDASVRLQRTVDDAEFARLLGELGCYPGTHASDYFRQVQQVTHCNASLLVGLMTAATVIAANILKNTSDLLHRASVLPSLNSLAGTDAKKFTRRPEGLRRE